MRVGFVGLGVMGGPMARNVLQRGHTLTVFDIAGPAVQSLVAEGARAAEDLAGVAAASEIVITMLPGPQQVEEVVLSPNGLAANLAAGSVYVDMSTAGPALARRVADGLAPRGVDAIDCPVGRTQSHAEAGKLLLLAGGEPEAIERARPVLMCMGDELIRCGSHGAGQAMKLVNNMLATVIAQADTEALIVGSKAGIQLETIRAVIARTMADNRFLSEALAQKALRGDFSPGFTLALARKDLRLATDLAGQVSVPVPLAAATAQVCSLIAAEGWDGKDVGGILGGQAELLGLHLREDPSAQLDGVPQ